MKLRNVTYASALLAALALSACSNDLDKNSEWGGKDVRFTSAIAGMSSRVANGSNAWQDGDQIGIYMTKAGETVDKAVTGNAQYKAAVNGALTATGTALAYPDEGNVDFTAYYPYTATVTNGAVAVDVSDQTKPIDLLYAKAANVAKSSDAVNLVFAHQLSYVVLNISSSDNTATADLKVVLKGTKTAGSFNLNDKSLTVTDASVKDITFNTNAEGTLSAAIALPASSLTDAKLEFILGDNTIEKPLSDNVASLAAGSKYTIPVILSNGNTPGTLKVNFGNATITDWTSGTVTGNIDVDFNQGGTTPDPDPQPGVETTIFEETFGTEAPASGTSSYVDNFTGYDNYGKLTFSNPYEGGKANIRQTKQIANNHLWLPKEYDNGLLISGINTAGYKNIKLTYEICPNTYGSTDTGNANAIEVKWNGTALKVEDHPFTNADNNKFITITITDGLTASDKATLEFFGAGSVNTIGYRIDNIKLVGTK